MDITELILTQHHEQRRTFALLDELADDPAGLAAVWERLTILLEVHAEAEEKFFYPRLLEVGTGGGDAESAASETKDAIKDHNEIRDAIAEAARHEVGLRRLVDGGPRGRRGQQRPHGRGGAGGPRRLPAARRPADPARDRGPVHRLREPARRPRDHAEDQDPDTYVAEHS